ncbi:MAG: hypothetical protein P8Y99_14555 [Calditrichaceae bacterium]
MRVLNSIIIVFIALLVMNPTLLAQNAQNDATLSFVDVVDNLDQTKHTSLYVKNYWKKIKGDEVTWQGIVYNVKGGRGKAQILVANKERKTYKGYNIVLVTYNLDTAAGLKLNQEIKFTAFIYNYKGRRGNPIIMYLDEAVIITPSDKK